MEKQAHSQLELFSQDTPQAQPNPCASSRVLAFLKQYEKAVLILMGFLVISVVSFSLGVEKGKRMLALNRAMRMDMAMAKGILRPGAQVLAPKEKLSLSEQQAAAKPQVVPFTQAPAAQMKSSAPNTKEKKRGMFTVQLASYQKKDFAQKEAAALSKKGITASVFASGNYFILCSGNFSSRQAAKILLVKLKKQYHDCIVRRL